MSDSRRFITHYAKYFDLKAPSSTFQLIALLFIGAVSGALASMVIHPHTLASSYFAIIIEGISTGVLAIALPAILTAIVIKTVKRRMKTKHALLATLLVTIWYAVFLFVDTLVFFVTNNTTATYVLLVLFNAAIYGYWFVMDKMVMGGGKSAIPVAAVQPVLNMLFYLPLDRYILDLGVPLGTTLIKLAGGVFVFLVVGYLFLYLIDRPAKKMLEVSGIKIFVSMVGQWLYDLTKDVNVVGYGISTKRNLEIDVLALRGKKGYKGIFVNPDIHFGPFRGVGGSVAPSYIGDVLTKRYKAAPVVMHAPLDIQDNPISTSQVYAISRHVENLLEDKRNFESARGGIFMGQKGECKAIRINIGKVNLFLLTKAPYVTEDMSRDIGIRLREFAERAGKKQALLIDAHNTRFESAGPEELIGVQKGSRYIRLYERAIEKAARNGAIGPLSFGASYKKLGRSLGNPKDIGDGYTSVCIFKFGDKKFCLVYFDSNNMLPGFRNKIREHIASAFGMDSELCTTDTHSINTVANTARASLGRYTDAGSVVPILNLMVEDALENIEPVSYSYKKKTIERFAVWGDKADALIERTSRDVRRILKYGVPLLAVLASVAAAWVIYVI